MRFARSLAAMALFLFAICAHVHAQWKKVASTGPSPRFEAGMVYDSVRGVDVLFGGADTSNTFGDTWVWNGATWTARAGGPGARTLPAMAFDSARGRVVLFGGDNGQDLGDTWEFDGNTWTHMASTGPSPRHG